MARRTSNWNRSTYRKPQYKGTYRGKPGSKNRYKRPSTKKSNDYNKMPSGQLLSIRRRKVGVANSYKASVPQKKKAKRGLAVINGILYKRKALKPRRR